MSRPCVSLWGTIRRKYMDCATGCPIDCFYEGENMLVIHPDERIDCGVCEPKCPAAAIIPDSDQRAAGWIAHNARYAVPWPNISIAKTPPSDAREFDGRPNKLRGYLLEKPGGIDA